ISFSSPLSLSQMSNMDSKWLLLMLYECHLESISFDADACGVHDHNIGVSWLADACGVHDHNIGVSRNLRRCGVSPAQETSVLVVVQREFTRLFEEGGVCYPVSQLRLVVVFDRFRNMQATSDRAEYTSQTETAFLFPRLLIALGYMRVPEDRAEYTFSNSCSRSFTTVGAGIVAPVVPVSKVPKAALAGLSSNNTRKNLQHTQVIY
ncbi:hypothetical protein Tco_0983726, partial [Tanacetum coccineum]